MQFKTTATVNPTPDSGVEYRSYHFEGRPDLDMAAEQLTELAKDGWTVVCSAVSYSPTRCPYLDAVLVRERREVNPDVFSRLSVSKKRYRIECTDEFGIHTDRRRYLVQCLECGQVIHRATTSVAFNIEQHDLVECSRTRVGGHEK